MPVNLSNAVLAANAKRILSDLAMSVLLQAIVHASEEEKATMKMM